MTVICGMKYPFQTRWWNIKPFKPYVPRNSEPRTLFNSLRIRNEVGDILLNIHCEENWNWGERILSWKLQTYWRRRLSNKNTDVVKLVGGKFFWNSSLEICQFRFNGPVREDVFGFVKCDWNNIHFNKILDIH